MAGTVLVGKWKELGESFLLYPVANGYYTVGSVAYDVIHVNVNKRNAQSYPVLTE